MDFEHDLTAKTRTKQIIYSEPGRDRVQLGVGITGYVGEKINIFLNYAAEFGSGFDAQKASLAFQFKF